MCSILPCDQLLLKWKLKANQGGDVMYLEMNGSHYHYGPTVELVCTPIFNGLWKSIFALTKCPLLNSWTRFLWTKKEVAPSLFPISLILSPLSLLTSLLFLCLVILSSFFLFFYLQMNGHKERMESKLSNEITSSCMLFQYYMHLYICQHSWRYWWAWNHLFSFLFYFFGYFLLVSGIEFTLWEPPFIQFRTA